MAPKQTVFVLTFTRHHGGEDSRLLGVLRVFDTPPLAFVLSVMTASAQDGKNLLSVSVLAFSYSLTELLAGRGSSH